MSFTIEHLGLAANDTTALKDWYVRVLGAEVVWGNGQVPPAWFVRLPGGPIFEIYPGRHVVKEITDNSLCGWRHVALRVENIEQSKALLEARGVIFTDPIKPAGGGGRVLFFEDCEGNLLHLVERPADSVFGAVR